MSIKQNALDSILAYVDAHTAWKASPPGDAKVEAKRIRGQKHSEMLEAARLLKLQKPER